VSCRTSSRTTWRTRVCTRQTEIHSLSALAVATSTFTRRWTGRKIRTLIGRGGEVRCVDYSPTGDNLASASQDETVRLWNAGTGTPLHVLKNHTDVVCGVRYSPQRDLVVSGSDDMTVRLWDTITGECCKILSGHTGGVYCVACSSNGNQAVQISQKGYGTWRQALVAKL